MKQKMKLLILALLVGGLGVFCFFLQAKPAEAYSNGDLVISEFKLSGTQWVELANTTSTDINLASSTWTLESMQVGPGGTIVNNLTSGIVPARGLLVISGVTMNTGDGFQNMLSLKENGSSIFALSYGQVAFGLEPHVNVGPASGQSGILTGTSTPVLSVTTTISKGWFNETMASFDCMNPPTPGVGMPPSLAAIVACIPGITTNMADTSSIPDATHATGLYFSTSTNGKIDYGSTSLNLTDQNTRILLETLGNNMKIDGGKIGLNASSSEFMRNPTNNITLSFYNMKSRGYENMNTTSIRVKDDSGNYVPTSSPNFPSMVGMSWTPGSNGGTFSFGSNHFSEYDINPTVVEVTPVPTPATNTSPSYTFGTNVTGTAVFGGDCAMASASTTNGNNTIVFGPLGVGTHSNCTVKVIDSFGVSTTLAVSSFTINSSLAAPTGISAVGTSTSQIYLSWNTASGANYYHIYRSTDNVTFISFATTSATNYNNTSLTTNTPYYYTVSSVGGTGESASSSAVSAYTFANVPAGLVITGTSTTYVVFSWGSNSNPAGTVYQYTVGPVNATTTATSVTTSPGNLTPNTQYTVYVLAMNGTGATTTQVNATDWTKPSDPHNLVNTASTTNSLSFSWIPNGNPTGTYYVLSGTGLSTVYTTSTSYTYTPLTSATTYTTIAVRSVSHEYPSTPSYIGGGDGIASVSTQANDPTSLATTASTSNSISLQWGSNGNAGGTVYQISGAGFATVTTTATSSAIGSLTPNTSYTFLVKAQNPDGSYTTGVSTGDYTKAADVVSLSAVPSVNSVDLSWGVNSNPGSTVYQVSGAGFSTVTTTASAITIGSLTANTSYTFHVRSQNHDSSVNSAVNLTTSTLAIAPPSAPTSVSAQPTSTSAIVISWTAMVTNTTDYFRVYSSTSNWGFLLIGTTTPSVTTFTHTGLGASTKHFYYVSAVNSGGETNCDGTYVSYTLPNPPTSLVITASSSNSLAASWNANGNGDNSTDNTQYELYYNGVTFSPQSITTTKTISLLNPNTQYSIVVKAQNGGGYLSASSSAVIDWTKPSDPQSLALTASTSNSLTFSWNANGNPAGTYYHLNNTAFSIYTTSTSYTVSSLSAATTYTTTTVTAVSHEYPSSPSYTSAGSSVASASTQAVIPASFIVTASTTNSISLQWSANGNSPGTVYKIIGISNPTSVTTTAVTTTIGSLTPDTCYGFTVKAQNPDGSYTTGVDAYDCTKSANPASLATTASTTNSISLSWNNNSNASGVTFQVYGSGFATTTVTGSGGSSTATVSIGSLTPNTHYTFNVRSQNGDSTYNTPVSVSEYTTAAIPGTPTATVLGPTSASLSWGANSNPVGTVYLVTFYPSGTPISPPATTTATSTTVTGLTLGNTYQFQVLAGYAAGIGSSPASSSSLPVTLSTPTVTSADASSIASTTATFNGNITSIGGNNVTARGFTYGTSTAYGTTSTASGSFGTGTYTASISSLTAGTNYHYKAYAQNSVGTSYGSDVMFTTAFAPSSGSPTSTITSGNTATATVAVPSDVTNAVVDYSSLTAGASTTLPGTLQVNADTSIGTVQVSIPSGTKITAATSTWNGVLNLPTIKDNSSVSVTPDSGNSATVNIVVEIGFGDVALTLDRAARILIPGYAGKDAGYYRGTTFTKITATCGDDTQATNDLLAVGADCKTTSGSDLVIWTKHFTSFIAYTQTSNNTGGSSGGGGGSPLLGTPPTLGVNPVVVKEGTMTNNRQITLTFDVKNAVSVAISEISNFAGTSWQIYNSNLGYTLSAGNGEKTLYIMFKSLDGSTTAVQTKKITLTGQSTNATACPTLAAGDMIKVVGKPAIYALNSDLQVLYFPSGNEFKSWRPTYGGYISISQACFDTLSVPTSYPGAVNYHPGSYVVKRSSSDQLYVVEPNNTLAKITPAAALALYGNAYKVMTVADTFWPHYVNRGVDISTATPHPGMLVKVSNVTYYVEADNTLREVTTAGMTANGFQTKFVHMLPSTAVEGWVKGTKMETAESGITNKTQ